MATTNKIGIQASVTAGIRTGGSDTTAAELRAILNEFLDSYVNVIDGGQLYQTEVGYNYLPIGLGASSFINKDYADNRYASVFVGLGDVLGQSNHTNNIDITSLDAASVLSIIDGVSKMSYSAHGNSGKFQTDDNGSVMDWSNGIVASAITQNSLGATYAHSIKNIFTSPLHEFTNTITLDGLSLTYDGNVYGLLEINTGNDYGGISANGQKVMLNGNSGYIDIWSDATTYLRVSGDGNYIELTSPNVDFNSANITALSTIKFTSGYGIDSKLTAGSDILNIGVTNANVINYGNASTVHNFLGTAIYELQVNAYVTDKLVTYNYGGAIASAIGVGFEGEENGVITMYFKTNGSRDAYSIKTPAIAYYSDLSLQNLTDNRTHSFPDASGTLALESYVSGYVTGTTNRVTVTAGVVDIAATYVGQTSIATLGTITTGVWNGTLLNPTYGGTGINNGSKTIDLSSPTSGYVLMSDGSGNATWQPSSTATVTELPAVISQTNNPPAHVLGERYLIGTVPTGVWVGNANSIAESDGVAWTYTAPVLNNTVFVTVTLTTLRYNGTAWVAYNGTAILQNGNTLAQILTVGTNDNFNVRLKRNNLLAAEITSTGFALRNAANTFQSEFQNAVTANRIVTMPDGDITILGRTTTAPVAGQIPHYFDVNRVKSVSNFTYSTGLLTCQMLSNTSGSSQILVSSISNTRGHLLLEKWSDGASVGVYTGTNVGRRNTSYLASNSANSSLNNAVGAGALVLGGAPSIIGLTGIASTDIGFRSDVIGLRIGELSGLGTINTVAFEVTSGISIFGGTIRLKNYTVATLPAGTQGDKAFVTDALAPTYLVAVAGGGAVVTEVFYNGAAWVCT